MRDNAALSPEFMDNIRNAMVQGVSSEVWLESPLRAVQTLIAQSCLGLNDKATTVSMARANGERQVVAHSGSSTHVDTYMQLLPALGNNTPLAPDAAVGATNNKGVPSHLGQRLSPLETELHRELDNRVIGAHMRLIVATRGGAASVITADDDVSNNSHGGPSTLGYFLLPLVARGFLVTVVEDAIKRESIWHPTL
eukprot:TRINITY_DN7089_c0_g1_i1.p1 TRINITY_DN7089_c0_g1~~TRINITY_DN7089_c0_g1_i1.p1  ORF type:complete len:196 (-),score=36.94 TRINITY_DN7089_c0_g1_i1:6-593(-)